MMRRFIATAALVLTMLLSAGGVVPEATAAPSTKASPCIPIGTPVSLELIAAALIFFPTIGKDLGPIAQANNGLGQYVDSPARPLCA